MRMTQFVPPLAISKVLMVYTFENSAFCALVLGGKVETEYALDKLEEMIAIKRAELALIRAPVETQEGPGPSR
mgnify:CR=1 FL=1